MRICKLLLTCLLICSASQLHSQDSTSIYNKLYNLPEKTVSSLSNRSQKLCDQLKHKTQKYLARFQRQEKRLKKKLWKKDSAAAKTLFANSDSDYSQFRQKITADNSISAGERNVYSAHMDSMKTVLRFLDANNVAGVSGALPPVMQQYNLLQNKLNETNAIKKFLATRQQYLKTQLEKFGLIKEFRQFQKNVYYYRTQVDEYKQALEDPSRLEARLLQIARKVPAFKAFFSKHSELAQLFSMPADETGSMVSLAGLQTRAMVQQNLLQRFGTGPDVSRSVQQNLQSGQDQLSQMKDKVNQLGNAGSDLDLPGFKPNSQRTKSFWQRIELGANLQNTPGNSFFPVTTDIGLSAGYRISDRSIAGLGASYKMGWGKNIRNISLSNEGVGFRSFIDWKLKGSFYASGGYEYNYQQPFNSMQQLYDLQAWQQSGLIGISKIISLNSKLLKKTKMQLLWDFLSYRQRPVTQPLKFRIGYAF